MEEGDRGKDKSLLVEILEAQTIAVIGALAVDFLLLALLSLLG